MAATSSPSSTSRRDARARTWLAWMLVGAGVMSCEGRTNPPRSVLVPAHEPSSASVAPPLSASLPTVKVPPPSRPCSSLTVNWTLDVPPQTKDCRSQGRLCDDMKETPVEVCSVDVMNHLVRFDEFEAIAKMDGKVGRRDRVTSVFLRGYLRRVSSIPRLYIKTSSADKKAFPIDADQRCGERLFWTVDLTQQSEDGAKCLRQGISALPCYGDTTVACCPMAVIDSDVEVAVQPVNQTVCIIGNKDAPQNHPHMRSQDRVPRKLLD